MKRIIFGGAFDPIHLGHIKIAQSALEQIDGNFVHFVPSYKLNYKKIDEPANYRYAMLELAIGDCHNFIVEQFELLQQRVVYTIETIKYLMHKYDQNDEWYLLIGNDQLEQFENWHEYREILRKVKLLVYQRDWKVNVDKMVLYNAEFIKAKNVDISSSTFKKTFDAKLLDKKIFQFIIDNGLYHKYLLPKYMTEKRYAHSLRVANMMKELFQKFDPSKVQIAYVIGLYHDFCKCFKQDELEKIAYEYLHLKPTHYKILHGPVASYYLYSVFNIKYLEILNAISRHTKPYDYGVGELSILDKAIFCCDKLEPLRTEQDVENIQYFRDLLNNNIEQCFFELLQAINKQYES